MDPAAPYSIIQTDLAKRSIALIMVKVIAGKWEASRSAVDGDSPVVAHGVITRFRQVRPVNLQVISDKQVQMTITIIVDKGAARAPSGFAAVAQACELRHVSECSIPIILIKNILAIIGNKDIFKAIVIVVRDGDCARPSTAHQARLLRNIAERAVSIIFIQPIRRARDGLAGARTAEHQNIQPAIIVIVEKGNSTADRLEDIFLLVNASIDGGGSKAGAGRHVGKMGQERPARRPSTRLRPNSPGGDALRQRPGLRLPPT